MLALYARRLRPALTLALVAAPAMAAAQVVAPTMPPHPALPWALGIATPQGQLIRYVYMPPQSVTLEYLVPLVPESPPPVAEPAPPSAESETRAGGNDPQDARESPPAGPRIVRQQVTVPGYYVRETTAGFHYPDRWVIEQTGLGAYRWRLLPAQFVSKY